MMRHRDHTRPPLRASYAANRSTVRSLPVLLAMKPLRLLSLAVALPVLFSTQTARAESASELPKDPEPYSRPAVVLGADGGLAAFVGGARSRVGAEPGTVLQLHGGYRFSSGIQPELSFSYLNFSGVGDSHPRIVSLTPGGRWWIPVNGPVRPWVGAHLGMDWVQAESGDVTNTQKYWSIDAGGGIDFMLTRHVALGTSISWAYADIISRPQDQPVPADYGGSVERPSYSLSWLTMRAGVTAFL